MFVLSSEAPTCLVTILWFSCGVAVPMREAAKPLIFEGFQAGSNVVLRGRRGTFCHILTCLQKCRTSFCVTGAILSRRFHKMSCILRRRCSTLDVCCCVLFAIRIVRAASSGDKGTGVGHRSCVAGQYLVQIRCVRNAQYF